MTTAIDAMQFRKALGAFTTGVTVVTTNGGDGKDYGLTANSFNSVSMDPPMVLWSLGKKSTSLPVFAAAEHFAVHILAADQESMSNRFAKSGTDKFAGCALARGHGGVPLLDGCSARFECRVVHRYEGGDHVIFVGEVLNFDSFNRPPLAFHGGNYGFVMKKSDDTADAGSSFGDGWLGFLLARAYYQLLMPVRKNLASQGLRDIDYNVLTVLSMGDGRTIAELDQLVSISGSRVTEEDIGMLVERGLVSLDRHGSKDAVVQFTDAGRRRGEPRLPRSAGHDAVAQARDPVDGGGAARSLAKGPFLARSEPVAGRRHDGRDLKRDPSAACRIRHEAAVRRIRPGGRTMARAVADKNTQATLFRGRQA